MLTPSAHRRPLLPRHKLLNPVRGHMHKAAQLANGAIDLDKHNLQTNSDACSTSDARADDVSIAIR